MLEAQLDEGHPQNPLRSDLRLLVPVFLSATCCWLVHRCPVRLGQKCKCAPWPGIKSHPCNAVTPRYFSTSCASLSEFSVTSEAGIDGLNPLTAITLNNYSLGANEVAVTDRTSMYGLYSWDGVASRWPLCLTFGARDRYYTFQNSALKKSFAASTSDTVLQALQNRTMQITAAPKDPTEVLGFDVSCQQGVFTTLVPDKSHFALGDSYEVSCGPDMRRACLPEVLIL